MIPKTIHQIWLGPDDPPVHWMQSWVDLALESDYDYRIWTEATIPPLENQAAFDYYMYNEDYPGAADVARVEILERDGGWYVDCDEELVDATGFYYDPMQQAKFVATQHPNPHPAYADRVPNTVFASELGSRILSRYVTIISRMFETGELEPAWNTVGGKALGKALRMAMKSKKNRPYFVPANTFYPFHFGERMDSDDPIYGIHHQMTTRQQPSWTDLPDYEL